MLAAERLHDWNAVNMILFGCFVHQFESLDIKICWLGEKGQVSDYQYICTFSTFMMASLSIRLFGHV